MLFCVDIEPRLSQFIPSDFLLPNHHNARFNPLVHWSARALYSDADVTITSKASFGKVRVHEIATQLHVPSNPLRSSGPSPGQVVALIRRGRSLDSGWHMIIVVLSF